MGKTNKNNASQKQSQSKQEKFGKKSSRVTEVDLEYQFFQDKKHGKSKKEFEKNMSKILKELQLIPDHTGKIKVEKKFKKENFEQYGIFSQEQQQQRGKPVKGGRIKQGSIMQMHMENLGAQTKKEHQNPYKNKKPQGFLDQDQELEEEMEELQRMMKGGQFKRQNMRFKTETIQESSSQPMQKKKHWEKNEERREKKDYKEKQFENFEEYISFEQARRGVAEKTLYQGVFVYNEKNPINCFIKCPEIQERIFFQNPIHKNRSLHNATVIFKVLRGKPTLVEDKAESISDYKDYQIDLEINAENYHNPVEEFIQGPKDMDLPDESPIFKKEADEFEDEDEEVSEGEEDDEELDEEDDDEEEESGDEEEVEEESFEEDEKIIDDIIDKKELEMFGAEDDETPPIDDSITDEEEDELNEYSSAFKVLQNGKKKERKEQKKSEQKRPKQKEQKKEEQQQQGKPGKVYAKIVYILDNPEFSRKFVCTLKKPFNSQSNLLLAVPIEKKLPIIIVTSAHQEISTENQKYYLAEFLFWPSNSQYPHGQIIEDIGDMGMVNIESEALLRNYNVYIDDFTEETYKYLETYEKDMDRETKEYKISQEEREKREDLTQKIVFTCDPVTARDLDDALSITKIRDDIYEIGVHIADVSHFVKEGTPVDDDARLRTTSVYLVQKVIPMLPRLLCENLCSLNPGIDRLTFSTFFYVREDGTIIKDIPPRFAKTIIRTCAKLNYDIVQEAIEGKITSAKELPLVYVPEGVDPEQVLTDALKMNEIAQRIRKRRFDNGSVSFEREKKRFQLDEAQYPVSYRVDTRKDSNFMVEEYMLLANQTVAKFIVDTCREIGLLRCHPPPGNMKINNFEILLDKLQLSMKFHSSKAIQESSQEIFNNPNIPETSKAVVRYRMCKILEAAKYFVVEKIPEQEWKHFALNFDVYTHFTSPIRRYPDVLVHRLLEQCMIHSSDVKKVVNKYHMLAIMEKCNECKINSKRVSDASDKLFMCLYMKKHPIFTQAIVTSCFSPCIEIYIPHIETEKKIFWKDFKSHKDTKLIEENERKSLKVRFEVNGRLIELSFKELEYCEVHVNGTSNFPIEFQINFVYTTPDGEKLVLN